MRCTPWLIFFNYGIICNNQVLSNSKDIYYILSKNVTAIAVWANMPTGTAGIHCFAPLSRFLLLAQVYWDMMGLLLTASF